MLQDLVVVVGQVAGAVEPLARTVFDFWNVHFVVGDVLLVWGMVVWGIDVEETPLEVVYDLLGPVVGSLLLLVVITGLLGGWVAFLFSTLAVHEVDSGLGINVFRLLPSFLPLMIAGGIAGLATETLTGALER
jgi:hypothetical protein